MQRHPHLQQRMEQQGTPLENAQAAMVLLHGRGSSAQGILPLAEHLNVEGIAYLAPSAAGNTWYPNRFTAPRQSNEPHLGAALQRVDNVLQTLQTAGIPAAKTVLLGFSQGACLALEYAARHPRRYGGVVGLSGGLIGAPGELTGYSGSLAKTPVFLGCSDVDFHIPLERVQETTHILRNMGAIVDERIYPGMGHTIIEDEIEAVQDMLRALA